MSIEFGLWAKVWRGARFISLAWTCWGAVAMSAADPVALADFFRKPQLGSPRMSPSGAHVAALVPAANGRRQLAVLNLADLASSRVIAGFSDADIATVQWVNEDRLVFTVTDAQSPYGRQDGEGLYSVDREGKQAPRSLIKRRQYGMTTGATRIADNELSVFNRLFAVLRDGSDDVIVEHLSLSPAGQPLALTLLRLDAVTGRSHSISAGAPEHSFGWVLDSQGEPRVVVTSYQGRSRLYWKVKADAAWSQVYEVDALDDQGQAIRPLAVDSNDVLYFVGRLDPADDTTSLLRLNLRDATSRPTSIVSIAGYDFDGNAQLDRGRLLRVDYLSDARGTHWFDPGLRAIQAQVDKLLPATVNRLDCGDCRETATVLVTAYSDRQPAIYGLYDVKAGTLARLGSSRPWIDPKAMAQRDLLHFAARDGLAIPVHLTRPPGSTAQAPMVVLVHGGPWLRGGEWGWYADSQFLASRGYVVVEPEFRGSTGFGSRHFRAGWKQWGLAMQDDVTDAARWAIEKGYADPNRVCIAGASYGGYAVLMGLIREPSLFRCGVEWVGVTDIELMYSINWSDLSESGKQYDLPALVGDPKADAAQLAATSPLRLASRLKQPLLMAYGGQDRRVPIEHGSRFRDAVRATNPNVEWIAYADEGHGWMLEANTVDFWSHVERFLAKNLKNAP